MAGAVLTRLSAFLGLDSSEFTKGVDQAVIDSKKLEQQQKQLRGQIQNTSFQVQDMAVQIAGGTDAMRAMGQQLPQLLSGFGLFGALAGTGVALAVPVWNALAGKVKEVSDYLDTSQDALNKADAATKELGANIVDLTYKYGNAAQAVKDYYEVEKSRRESEFIFNFNKGLDEAIDNLYRLGSTAVPQLNELGDVINNELVFGVDQLAKKLKTSIPAADALYVSLIRLRGAAPGSKEQIQAAKDYAEAVKLIGPGALSANDELSKLIKTADQFAQQAIQKAAKADADKAKQRAETIAGINLQIEKNNLTTIAGERVAAAKRDGDEIKAIQEATNLAVSLKRKEIEEQTRKDGINRDKLLSSEIQKLNAEEADKIAAYRKQLNDRVRDDNLKAEAAALEEEFSMLEAQAARRATLGKALGGDIASTERATERIALQEQLLGLQDSEIQKQLALFDLETKRKALLDAGNRPEQVEIFIAAQQQLIDKQKQLNDTTKQYNVITSNIESAIDSFVDTGKLKFDDLAKSILKDLLKIQLKALAIGFLKNIFPTSFITGGGGGGAFADGGSPPIGVPSLVGERGPELFVPRGAGTIIPNDKLGGQSTQITYNINAIDSKGVRDFIYGNAKDLNAAVSFHASTLTGSRGRA